MRQFKTRREYQSMTATRHAKPPAQADGGDVCAPDLIGPVYRHAPEQVEGYTLCFGYGRAVLGLGAMPAKLMLRISR